ncbi:MAG: hypothetical protein RRY11_07445 [Terrisporobacter sp.]
MITGCIIIILSVWAYKMHETISRKKSEKAKIEKFISKLEVEYKEIRCFKHDYKNILISISGYIEDRDLDGLEKFYSENIIKVENIKRYKMWKN